MQEHRLVKQSLQRLRNINGISACSEVPLLGRSVDLAYYSKGCLYTVEFKLRDWRRAIRQARDHLLAADYAYICMPKRDITHFMRTELEELGIGLLFYREGADWPFEQVIEARRSEDTSTTVRGWTLKFIKENYRER